MLLLDTLYGWIIRTSAEAAVIVILILTVQHLLKKRITARWRYALWLILLVRLIMPWTPESPLSLYNVFPQAAVSDPQPSFAEQVMNGIAPFALDTQVRGGAQADDAVSTKTALQIVWLVGALLVLSRIVAANFRFWMLVRKHAPFDDTAILELLARCKALIGVQSEVRLVVTNAVTSPALFGLWRPRLLLPAALLESVNLTTLRYVFLHELAHLKRHDVLVTWLTTLLQAVHWFNLFVWYAFGRMRTDRETACDALALSCVGPHESRPYGDTILELLERTCQARRVPGMAGIIEDRSQIRRRIMLIGSFTRSSYRWSVLATVVILLLGTAVLTKAQAVPKASPVANAPVAADTADPPKARALFDEAEALYKHKKYEQAIEKYREVYQKYPAWHYSATSMMMVGICHEHMGDKEQAIKDLEAAAREYPDVKQYSESIHYYLGDSYVAAGRRTEALAEFKTCVALCEISGKRGFQYDDSKNWIFELENTRAAGLTGPRLQFRWVAQEGEDVPVEVIQGYPREGSTPKSYRLLKDVLVSEKDIAKAQLTPDAQTPGEYQIEVELGQDATSKFSDATAANIGRQLAIVFDGKVVSAPTLRSPISGGAACITGHFTREEAEKVVQAIKHATLGGETKP